MIENKITTIFYKSNLDSLERKDQDLINSAIKALNSAYAPYSGFLVGTSILLENGEIISGNNQENVAYPSGLCAERVAIFYAGSKYPDVKVKTIAISAISKKFEIEDMISPCGACRQALSEYELKQSNPLELYFMGTSGEIASSKSVENMTNFSQKS